LYQKLTFWARRCTASKSEVWQSYQKKYYSGFNQNYFCRE